MLERRVSLKDSWSRVSSADLRVLSQRTVSILGEIQEILDDRSVKLTQRSNLKA